MSYEVHLTWGDFTKLIRKSYQNKDNNNVFDNKNNNGNAKYKY